MSPCAVSKGRTFPATHGPERPRQETYPGPLLSALTYAFFTPMFSSPKTAMNALLSTLSALPREIAVTLTSAADLPRLSPRGSPHPDDVLLLSVPALDGLLEGGLPR